MQYKKIYVEWVDSCSDTNAWVGEIEAKEWANNDDWYIKQIGFLIHESKEYILLASRINYQKKDTVISGLFKIPKAVIRYKKFIK